MAGYEYQALDRQGRAVKGVIDGDAERQVRALLRERGLTPLYVGAIRTQPETGAQARRPWRGRRGISGSELALLTRQFATLVRAGLTLEECLNALIEQTESARTRNILAGVRGRMLEGQSLARSMANFPQAFPDIYRVMIDAGEQSGRLVEVLERLADYTENRQALRQKVLLAFIYPALVTTVAVAVVALLLVYVVPQVTRVFENTGQALPLVTRVLISISDFARASGLVWIAGGTIALVAFVAALRSPAVRFRWHHLLLRLPVIGRVTRGVNAARFADTLGILTASGIPLLPALQSAVPVVNNLPMRAGVEEALRQVREGGSLSRSLGKTRLFPPLVIHLIASGESSGRLDAMLQRAAEAQARELENWVKALTALLEPVLILVMGVIVLFIVIAILLPIFEMNQLIK
ncbi:general secretion pathway protein F [Sulfurifustis variabilis]|uniref:General secretion pathway protein F n=1 Tax=Sulfurifustis variabilis TaxID=1675686 RepID=A0A1B4V3S3_9GAMM|nr:type II secretion system inner membrane protein GspF [Sulfurifustis variabilis]BAU48198.1 general secretion pathway protein F [Sulfurifustis variabilis]